MRIFSDQISEWCWRIGSPVIVVTMMALCIMATSVLADEVLYCTDTDATGFGWDKNGNATPPRRFKLERFTISVKSDDQRVLATGELLFCKRSLVNEDRIICDIVNGGWVWVFFKNTYSRAFLAGPPAGGGDPNIWIAYGTCTKF